MLKLTPLLLACAVLLPASLNAAPQDYAFNARLTRTDDSLQRVLLPAQIIGDLAQRNLGDIAVFNADGKPLPQIVMATPAAVSEHRLELPFHEFDTFLKQRSKTVTRREQNQQDGQLSELSTTEVVTVESVRKDYLIELQPDDTRRDYESIELDWRHQPASQVLKLRAEAGDELDRLRTIIAQKSLAVSGSDDIEWRSLPRISGNNKYLRLTAINDIESFELLGATGHYRETAPPPNVVIEVIPRQVREDGVNYYYFELPSAIPPAAMRILPAESNSVLRGRLYLKMRNSEQRSLVERNFRQHNLVGDGVKASEPLKLPRSLYSEIWFTLADNPQQVPSVELLYPQRELVFLADGKAPYTLAWGNHEVLTPPPSLRGLVDTDLARAGETAIAVTLLAIEEAGGAARLAPEAEIPWRKWLLWGLLILAAIVTGRMAMKLYREMNAQQ